MPTHYSNDIVPKGQDCRKKFNYDDQNALDCINKYLEIIGSIRKSCAFVPNDTLIAVDMAGNVMNHFSNTGVTASAPVNRLALALL